MELRQLRYFVVVAEELNFTRAAARIPVAVAALSTQIQRLERELGVRLLDRTTHSVSLTPAGSQFLEVARATLAGLDRGVDAVRRSAPVATLVVAVVEEGLAELTQPVLDEVRRRLPRVQLRVLPCPASELFTRVDEIDVVLWVHPGPPFPGWTFTPILESDAVVVLGDGHRLASAPSLRADDVLDETFVRVPDEARPWFVRHYLEDVRQGPPRALSETQVRDVPGGQSVVSFDGSVMVQPLAKLRYFQRPGLRWIRLDDVAPFPLGVAVRDGDERPEVTAVVDVALECRDRVDLGEGTRPAAEPVGGDASPDADVGDGVGDGAGDVRVHVDHGTTDG